MVVVVLRKWACCGVYRGGDGSSGGACDGDDKLC